MSISTPTGAFTHKLPAPDYEPQVSQAWRSIDKLSLAEPQDIAPHLLGLIEIKEKLELAIAVASQKEEV